MPRTLIQFYIYTYSYSLLEYVRVRSTPITILPMSVSMRCLLAVRLCRVEEYAYKFFVNECKHEHKHKHT